MAIKAEREVARADMNDAYGVTVWQEAAEMEYTPADARKLAAEIIRAADEADRVVAEDRQRAASISPPQVMRDFMAIGQQDGVIL